MLEIISTTGFIQKAGHPQVNFISLKKFLTYISLSFINFVTNLCQIFLLSPEGIDWFINFKSTISSTYRASAKSIVRNLFFKNSGICMTPSCKLMENKDYSFEGMCSCRRALYVWFWYGTILPRGHFIIDKATQRKSTEKKTRD